MAAKLMSAADLHKVVYCYMTLHTGEKVEYELVNREVKMMRGAGGIAMVPMVKIRKRGDKTDGGLYRMNALFYVMPDGEVKR